MTTASAEKPAAPLRAAARFFRTPKGLLTIVLVALAVVAAPGEGWRWSGPNLAAAALAAMAVDVPLLRWRRRRWEFPSGALLTGLIVAMVLSPHEPWLVVAAISALAVVSKYIARTKTANIFNPAAFAMVATFYVFDTGQSWWGALPDLSIWWLALLTGTGIFIADRVNKMPLVVGFLAIYYGLFTIVAFTGSPAHVAEIYRAPDLQAVVFFAFFILTDPPTSPTKYRDQLVFAAISAVVAFGIFELVGAAYYLLAGVLVANVWEAWRRVRRRKTLHHKPHSHRRAQATAPGPA